VKSGARRQNSLRQKFTRGEVVRMLGVKPGQLDSWAKLGLIAAGVKTGEPSYGFADLVAIETLKRLTAERIPARRLKRSLTALRHQLGDDTATLDKLRVTTNGRQVVVSSPETGNAPIEPLTGQMVLEFDASRIAEKIRALPSRTAEQWFEMGLAYDLKPATMRRAADAYRHAVRLAPEWVEAHINLGTALFHLKQVLSARRCFKIALDLDPLNALAHFNFGCALESMGNRRGAIEEMERAVTLDGSRADAHLNLAMLYDREGDKELMQEQLQQYLHCEPEGRWADFARSKLPIDPASAPIAASARGKVTPFRRR
jgi:tetratricopeptide (TPR) repeat protein